MLKTSYLQGLGTVIGAILYGLTPPVQATGLDFSSGWVTLGDVRRESPRQIHLSTNSLSDDDLDLGAGRGDFNFSLNESALVGLGELETFLGINASQLDLGGVAYEGSALKTILTVNSPSELSFDWEFLTNETANVLLPNRGPFNDYGLFLIGQSVNPLADYLSTNQGSCTLGFDSCTEVQRKTYLLNPGTYTLAFGVIDIDDFAITSALSVSNVTLTPSQGEPTPVSEPNLVFGLLAFGGLGAKLLNQLKIKS